MKNGIFKFVQNKHETPLAHVLTDPYFHMHIKDIAFCIFEPRHEISNNVVCATSKSSDQPAHTRSLIRAFTSGLNIL